MVSLCLVFHVFLRLCVLFQQCRVDLISIASIPWRVILVCELCNKFIWYLSNKYTRILLLFFSRGWSILFMTSLNLTNLGKINIRIVGNTVDHVDMPFLMDRIVIEDIIKQLAFGGLNYTKIMIFSRGLDYIFDMFLNL